MIKSGIYKILNKKNGKCYVGSALDIRTRLRRHRVDLGNKKHHSLKLQRAWNKYGSEHFEFAVIEDVQEVYKLIEREQYWMDQFDVVKNGYNCYPTAGSSRGIKLSKEHRDKLSFAKQNMSAEVKARMSSGQMGKKHSEKTKIKMSASRIGKPLSVEHRKKLSISRIGMKFSDEHRKSLKTASLKRHFREDSIKATVRKSI